MSCVRGLAIVLMAMVGGGCGGGETGDSARPVDVVTPPKVATGEVKPAPVVATPAPVVVVPVPEVAPVPRAPDDPDAQIELARSYLSQGDLDRAAVAAKRAIRLAPRSSAAFNTLGRVERARFRYDQAREAFSQAIDLNPDNGYAWNNLGLTLLELGLHQEAANALEEATSRGTPTGYMWNNLGLAYEHLDALDEARVAYDAGAKAGSAAAKASRRRLQGVVSIVATVDEAEVVEAFLKAEDEAAVPVGGVDSPTPDDSDSVDR